MPVKVVDTIKPDGIPLGSSQFPTVEDIDILGGYQVVGTDTARNNIPAVNRKQGMLVYVVADSLFYQLASDLVTWNIANFAGDAILAGDVTGTGSANTVTKIRGVTVSTNSVANDGYALTSVGGTWVPKGVATVFNVKNFGAKGDNVHDDTAAFQACIAAKDAAGGGTVYIPVGQYKLTSSIDVGTQAFIFRGDCVYRKGAALFGFPAIDFNVLGSVLNFPNTTNGLTVNTSGIIGRIQDIGLVGPGSGNTAGILFNLPFVDLFNVSINNFWIGLQLGNAEQSSITRLDCCGDGYGVADGYFLNGGFPTSLRFYNYVAQFCNYPVYFTAGDGITFFGGLIQANTNGCYQNNLCRQITYDTVWFEDQGYPSSPHGAADLIFDATNASVSNITMRSCRLTADSPTFSILGTFVAENISWYDCLFGSTFIIPSSGASLWTVVNCGNVLDNSGSAVVLSDTTIQAPISIQPPQNFYGYFNLTSGNNNNLPAAVSGTVLFSQLITLGNYTITGMTAATNGTIQTLKNLVPGGYTMTITNNDSNSSAGNRIFTNNGNSITCSVFTMIYLTVSHNISTAGWYELSHSSASSLSLNTFTVTTATYTVDSNITLDYQLLCNRAGAITITLPAPTVGRTLVIKDASGNAVTNNITISHHSAETIDGATTFVISNSYQSVTLSSDGTNWFAV